LGSRTRTTHNAACSPIWLAVGSAGPLLIGVPIRCPRQIRAFSGRRWQDRSMVEFAGTMTRSRLHRILADHGFDPNAYSLLGGTLLRRMCWTTGDLSGSCTTRSAASSPALHRSLRKTWRVASWPTFCGGTPRHERRSRQVSSDARPSACPVGRPYPRSPRRGCQPSGDTQPSSITWHTTERARHCACGSTLLSGHMVWLRQARNGRHPAPLPYAQPERHDPSKGRA
jgi:hypothetical protein